MTNIRKSGNFFVDVHNHDKLQELYKLGYFINPRDAFFLFLLNDHDVLHLLSDITLDKIVMEWRTMDANKMKTRRDVTDWLRERV
jgi:hypothetical protein